MAEGERLVFEARTPKWQAWGVILQGFFFLLFWGGSLSVGLVCEGLLGPVLPQSFWLAGFREGLGRYFPFIIFWVALPFIAYSAVRSGLWRLSHPLFAKAVLDDRGLALMREGDWGLAINWSEVLAICVDEANPKPKRLVMRISVYTEAGYASLALFQRKEELLEAILQRTGFEKTKSGFVDWYTVPLTQQPPSAKPGHRALEWLPSDPEDYRQLNRWRHRRLAALVLILLAWAGVWLWSRQTTPINELPTEVHSVALPEGVRLTSSPVWAADSSRLYLTLYRSSTNEQDGEINLVALAEAQPDGQLVQLTPWYEHGLGALACSPAGWLAFGKARNQLTQAEQKTLKRVGGPASYTAEELRLIGRKRAQDLWVVAPGAKRPVLVTQPAPAGSLHNLAWSPSSKRVAALCGLVEAEGYSTSLVVLAVNGDAALQRRYPLPEGIEVGSSKRAVWAPDETKLALVGYRTRPDGARSDYSDRLLVLDPASGQWKDLGALARPETVSPCEPCWSDDSRALTVMAADWRGVGADEVDVATGKRARRCRAFIPGPYGVAAGADWAPQGKALAVELCLPDYTPGRSHATAQDLVLESAKGLTRFDFVAEWWAGLTAWSPDGKWLATGAGSGELYFIRVPEGVW